MKTEIDRKVLDVLIVDDHSLFRNGLKILLSTSGQFNVIGEAENGSDFLELLAHVNPDIVLMDIDMPVMDGIQATKEALKKYPALKVITLSMFGEEEYYYKMIEAGVKGFLLKNSDINEVKSALITVYEGGKYFSQELLYNVVKNIRTTYKDQEITEALSDREMEVLI